MGEENEVEEEREEVLKEQNQWIAILFVLSLPGGLTFVLWCTLSNRLQMYFVFQFSSAETLEELFSTYMSLASTHSNESIPMNMRTCQRCITSTNIPT